MLYIKIVPFRKSVILSSAKDSRTINTDFPQARNGTLRQSFTLIELLVTLAIVAILSVVVIITLNPSELLKQARDSNRLSDLSTLNTALSAYSADVNGGFMGTSSVVYVSIPDTTSTCANLGLPTLPTGWSYNCVTSTSTKLSNGRGWIPVNFGNISFGSPLSSLPADPINTTTTGNYYTYVSGGSFILTAIPESTRQRTALSSNPNISNYPGVIAMGNNVSLSPLYNPSGLVGYWKFDGDVIDSSGYGNNGTWYGASVSRYVVGKVGTHAGYFNGTSDYVDLPGVIPQSSQITLSMWAKNTGAGRAISVSLGATYLDQCYSGSTLFGISTTIGGQSLVTGDVCGDNNWRNYVGVYDGSTARLYINGAQVGSPIAKTGLTAGVTGAIGRFSGGGFNLAGIVDDVRIYNRALSAAEISALYNATK